MRIRSTKPWQQFVASTTAQACGVEVHYDGPLPTGNKPYVGLAPVVGARRYLYLLLDGQDVLYVGRSWRPADRLAQHRRKTWWPRVSHLVLLRVDAGDPKSSDVVIDHLERVAIAQLRPLCNVARPRTRVGA